MGNTSSVGTGPSPAHSINYPLDPNSESAMHSPRSGLFDSHLGHSVDQGQPLPVYHSLTPSDHNRGSSSRLGSAAFLGGRQNLRESQFNTFASEEHIDDSWASHGGGHFPPNGSPVGPDDFGDYPHGDGHWDPRGGGGGGGLPPVAAAGNAPHAGGPNDAGADFNILTKKADEIFFDFFTEQAATVAKVVANILSWVTVINPNAPETVSTVREGATIFKNFLGAMQLPKKMWNTGVVVAEMCIPNMNGGLLTFEDGVWFYKWDGILKKTNNLIKEFTSFFSSGTDLTELVAKLVTTGSEAFKAIKTTNFVMTIIGSTRNFAENCHKLHEYRMECAAKGKSVEAGRVMLYLTNIAQAVCYIAFGILMVVAVGAAIVMPQVAILPLLSAGLFFTIASVIQEKIWDPEMKGKNIAARTVEQLQTKAAQILATQGA